MAKKYIVEGNLDHDRVSYKTGDMLMLEDDVAAGLLAIGRVKPAVEDLSKPEETQPVAPVQPAAEKPEDVKEPTTPPAPQFPPISSFRAEASAPAQPTPEQIANDLNLQ